MMKKQTANEEQSKLFDNLDQVMADYVTNVIELIDLPPDEMLKKKPTPDLIRSVGKIGVLEPVLLIEARPDPADPWRYTIFDGERRVQAARAAGLKVIHAVVHPIGAQTASVLSLIANAQRSRNVAREYERVSELLDAGYSPRQIAYATGMPQAGIDKLLKLRNLTPALMTALENGKISESTAFDVAGMMPVMQDEAAAVFDKSGKLQAKDIKTIKSVRVQAAQATIPADLYDEPEPDTSHDPVILWTEIDAAHTFLDTRGIPRQNGHVMSLPERIRLALK